LSYLAAKFGRECSKLEKEHMQTVVIIWLIVSLLASILVVAALMLSSRISQTEGVSENYDEWEAPEVAQEIYPRQAEQ
jgi:Na+-transporting NADH:ubiquinone oxidoreductase subunit NqrC